jgi:hypothetical protein
MCLPLAPFLWHISRYLYCHTPSSSHSSRSHHRLHSSNVRPCLPHPCDGLKTWVHRSLVAQPHRAWYLFWYTWYLVGGVVTHWGDHLITLVMVEWLRTWWTLLCHAYELYPWISCDFGDASRISCIHVLVCLLCDWKIRPRYRRNSTKNFWWDKG